MARTILGAQITVGMARRFSPFARGLLRYGLLGGFFLGVLFMLSGCEALGPHAEVLRGNYLFGQGEHRAAGEAYRTAASWGAHGAFVAYNLGNVAYAQGDRGAAENLWGTAGESDMEEVRFRAEFNRGVSAMDRGNYEEAYRRFRAALLIRPGTEVAQVNLELAYDRLQAQESAERDAAVTDTSEPAESQQELLDTLQQYEQERWRARAEDSPEPEPEVDDW